MKVIGRIKKSTEWVSNLAYSRKSSGKIRICNTQFSMSLIVCNNSINFIDNLTNALQGRSIDTYKANHDIQSIIKGIQVCRDNIDKVGYEWNLQLEWNEEASHLLSYSNEGISLPRLNKRHLLHHLKSI